MWYGLDDDKEPVDMDYFLVVSAISLVGTGMWVAMREWHQTLVSVLMLLLLFAVMAWQTRWFKRPMRLGRRWWVWVTAATLVCSVLAVARVRWENTRLLGAEVCGVKLRMYEEMHVRTDNADRAECTYTTTGWYSLLKTYANDPAFLWRNPK